MRLEREIGRLSQQIEVQNAHLTSQKQAIDQLKAELSATKQSLAEVGQSDLAKKTLLL